MKRFFIVVMLALVSITADADWRYRAERYKSFEAEVPKGGIVFVGDSITDLGEWWEFFGDRPEILNRGVSGTTSEEMLAHISSITAIEPEKMFLMIGINDFVVPRIAGPDKTVSRIEKIILAVREASPSTKLFIESILPVSENNTRISADDIILANEGLKKLCRKYGLRYIDLWSSFVIKGRKCLDPSLSNDGLHLNVRGYSIWTHKISKYVGYSSILPENPEVSYYGLRGSFGMRASAFRYLPVNGNYPVLIKGDDGNCSSTREYLGGKRVRNRSIGWGTGTVKKENLEIISKMIYGTDSEIPFSQCRVLINHPGDAILNRTSGNKALTMRELFDGRWMSGYRRFDEVGFRQFSWNNRQPHKWFTFDIGEYARLSKAVVMPYCGFTQSDPAIFELWAYTGEGDVPPITPEDWFETDPKWVRIARVDASAEYEKTRKFRLDNSGIGNPEVDPCVNGLEFRTGNCCKEIPSARFYRFRMLNNYYGLVRYEYEEFMNFYDYTHACTMSELRLWKNDAPVCINDWEEPRRPYSEAKARDIVLFYCGGPKDGMKKTSPNFTDYIITDEKEPRWLFDGSLLLQQYPDNTHTYYGMGRMVKDGVTSFRLPADRNQIELLWRDWFEYIIPRLEKQIGEARKIVRQPFRKHQLVLMLSVLPKHNISDYEWGKLNGTDIIDWDDWDQAKKAYFWQIDRLVSQFKACHYENIDLLGFYWPQEDAGIAVWHLKELADYIHSKGYQFNYIPMFNKNHCVYPLYSTWIDSGFDFTYLQPNYFFDSKVPYSRLEEACRMAEKYGMGLEMEFSPSNHPENIERLEHYMNVFDSCGVFENSRSIAYYQRYRDFSDLKESKGKDEYKYSLYQRLRDYVAKRHENK